MALRDGADDEFEFLLNFLASDGVNPDPNPGPPRGTAAGSRKGGEDDRSLRIQMGSDGKLDLGQVKAFYEGKNVRAGKGPMTDGPGFTDHSRNHPGKSGENPGLYFDANTSVSRTVSEREDETGSPSREPLASTLPDTDLTDDAQWGHAKAFGSPPLIEKPGRWVEVVSEQEAKQLLLEISDALGLEFPPNNDEATRPAVDRPRTLGEIKNAVEFLVRMDELAWRRSEYGANQGVFEPGNVSAVEDRIRLWERIARDNCPK